MENKQISNFIEAEIDICKSFVKRVKKFRKEYDSDQVKAYQDNSHERIYNTFDEEYLTNMEHIIKEEIVPHIDKYKNKNCTSPKELSEFILVRDRIAYQIQEKNRERLTDINIKIIWREQ